MEEAGLGIYTIILFTKRPTQIKCPETFLEVLGKWVCTWMWEDMQLMGEDGWLKAAIQEIQENTLVAVTDGLYMCALSQCELLCLHPGMLARQGHGRLMGVF